MSSFLNAFWRLLHFNFLQVTNVPKWVSFFLILKYVTIFFSIFTYVSFFLSLYNNSSFSIDRLIYFFSIAIILILIDLFKEVQYRFIISDKKLELNQFFTIHRDGFISSLKFFVHIIIWLLAVALSVMFFICIIAILFHYNEFYNDFYFRDNSIGWDFVLLTEEYFFVFLLVIIWQFDVIAMYEPRLRNYVETKYIDRKNREILVSQFERELQNFKKDKTVYMRAIKHELGNKIPAIRNQFSDLQNALQNFSQKKQVFDIKMKIRESLQGENEKNIDSFKDVLKRLEDTLAYTNNMIESMESVITMDQGSLKLIPKHMISFLKKLEKSVKGKFPNTEIDTKLEGYLGAKEPWLIDPIQFKLLYDNFMQNSSDHGFPEDKTEDKKRKILIIAHKTASRIELKLLNNGIPKDENLTIADFIKFEHKAGITGNKGIGGFAMGRVVHNHNGTINFIEDFSEFPEYCFGLSIMLPREPKQLI
jgi:signal transduction histidine kinase